MPKGRANCKNIFVFSDKKERRDQVWLVFTWNPIPGSHSDLIGFDMNSPPIDDYT